MHRFEFNGVDSETEFCRDDQHHFDIEMCEVNAENLFKSKGN